MTSFRSSVFAFFATVITLSVACTERWSDAPAPAAVVLPASAIEDSLLAIPVVGGFRPRAVLFVDASCPNSMYALEQAMADSSVASRLAISYYPQVDRDPVARFETTALECARQVGAFSQYVTQRLDDAGRGGRAVELSASAIGIDTARFMQCVADPRTESIVARHQAFAERYGVSVLPLLVHQDASTVGRDSVIQAFTRLK